MVEAVALEKQTGMRRDLNERPVSGQRSRSLMARVKEGGPGDGSDNVCGSLWALCQQSRDWLEGVTGEVKTTLVRLVL